jgi:hypothetical protein
MPRPQFSLKSLLWLMAVVAAFLGGIAVHKHLDRPVMATVLYHGRPAIGPRETMILRDGSQWMRIDNE